MTPVLDTALARLLFALVPIEVRRPDGRGVGTSFLFTSTHPAGTVPVLVTNRSLVERADRGWFYFTRSEGGAAVLGEHLAFEMEDFGSLWHPHPDPQVDLAVAPFGPIPAQLKKAGRTAHVSSIDCSLVPAVGSAEVDVVEQVLVPGFVAGLQDRAHIVPLTQQGLTASPYHLDYDGRPAFVVQVPVYPGLGGSPVVVIRRDSRPASGRIERTTEIQLVGMLSDVAEWRPGGLTFVPIPPAPPAQGATWVPFARAIRAERIADAVDSLLRSLEAPRPENASSGVSAVPPDGAAEGAHEKRSDAVEERIDGPA